MHLIESNELVALQHRKTGLKSTGGSKNNFPGFFDIVKPFEGKENTCNANENEIRTAAEAIKRYNIFYSIHVAVCCSLIANSQYLYWL